MIPALNMRGVEEQGTASHPKATLEFTVGCSHYLIYQRFLVFFFLTMKHRLTCMVLAGTIKQNRNYAFEIQGRWCFEFNAFAYFYRQKSLLKNYRGKKHPLGVRVGII